MALDLRLGTLSYVDANRFGTDVGGTIKSTERDRDHGRRPRLR